MAYRFYPASHNKKVAPAPMPLVLNTKSLSAFPALGSGSSGSGSGSGSGSSSLPAPASGEKKVQMPVKLDYKKTAIMAPPSAVELEKMMAASNKAREAKVTPSSMIPTHCYDEFGEDYDGPDEWEMEREAEEFQLNAALPVGGRRGGF